MNGSVAGQTWLVLSIAVTLLLTLIAWVLKSQDKSVSAFISATDKVKYKAIDTKFVKPAVKPKSRRDINRLERRLKKYFPALDTKLQHNRIITKNGQSKMMLTIDKQVSKGARMLGDARVINFHSLPSVNELKQLFDGQSGQPSH